ncbi:MAG: BlaI/MecI/CopY family transcriptional regulator [Gammaproteobacteria bacterium]|jgi:BlaI family penicillinase repressor
MVHREHLHLSRRERQIMDVLYLLGEASAAEVRARLPGAPSDSAVRTILRKLEEKEHVVHRVDGPRYIYRATVPSTEARAGAIARLIDTFFSGSPFDAVAGLFGSSRAELSDDDLARLEDMVRTELAHRREADEVADDAE